VAFTTLGYGDVALTGRWRMLASIQAIMRTSFIFELLANNLFEKIYQYG